MAIIKKIKFFTFAAVLASPLAATAGPSLYSITVLPSEMDGAAAMNANGHVVGSSIGGVLVWSESGIKHLATLTSRYSDGLGINNRDDVAGTSYVDAGSIGFANIQGEVRNIGAAAPEFAMSYARAINDVGQVVGAVYGPQYSFSRAYVYYNGMVQLLPTLGGNTGLAAAINGRGDITGSAGLPDDGTGNDRRHAFLYQMGRMTDLGTLGGTFSVGLDVNESGQVAGTSTVNEQVAHGFLYSRGKMVDLGTLGGGSSQAHALNNWGVVVGDSFNASYSLRGFIYARGKMVDLNRLIDPMAGWEISYGLDINDAFQVLAVACRPNTQDCRKVRLEPLVGLLKLGAASFIDELARN
jgi:probable HAF family extracellular repeat protein